MNDVDGDQDPSGLHDPDQGPKIDIPSVREDSGMRHGSARDHVKRTATRAARIAVDREAAKYQAQIAGIIADKDRQISNQAKTIHELQTAVTTLEQRIVTIDAVAEAKTNGRA